jgi:hypothetical protein
MSDLDSATNDDLFALFEVILAGSKIRHMKEARRVEFVLPDGAPQGGADAWLFDPQRNGPLFARGHDDSTLRIECARQLLVRLVLDPAFKLGEDDEVEVRGNIDDLLPLAHSVVEQSSALGIRLQKGSAP